MPFDRMIELVDWWARDRNRSDVFAQIGESDYVADHIETRRFLTPEQFSTYMSESHAVIAHAGTGTIIEALRRQKPLLVLPRLADLRETRTDHQIPTAEHFEKSGYILAAYEEKTFTEKLDQLLSFRPSAVLGDQCESPIIGKIRDFISA